MENDFQKMINKAVEIKAKYNEIEPKKWQVEQGMMGLMTDVGELSEALMAYRGYRKDVNKDVKKILEHELSDVLFSIIIIAKKIGVDLEKSFWRTMEEIEKRINK